MALVGKLGLEPGSADKGGTQAGSGDVPPTISTTVGSAGVLGRTFLIAPVRGLPHAAWARVVEGLEGEGWRVYWPARDTDQSDPTGLRICRANAAAIAAADAVHVIWDGASQGCLFDLGMAFALGKRVIQLELPPTSESKSFQNMVRAWAT